VGQCSLAGGSVGRWARFYESLRFRIACGGTAAALYAVFLWYLRRSSYTADPLLNTYLSMAGSLVAFTFAANAMVRFRGTRDRASLILAFGFVLAGLIEAATSMTTFRETLVASTTGNQVSLGWLAGRTLLGILMLAALFVERRNPVSRDPGKEIAGATLIVGTVAYLTSVFYFLLPEAPRIHSGTLFPRAWDLLPAGIYAAVAIGFGRRLRRATTSLDRALVVAAILNLLGHLTMSQSQRMMDASFMLAHVLVASSYAAVLGGTLLDNAQLFDQVSHLAASDSLTGLANHRQFFDVLESEIQRSRRTGRSFAILLFDLNGLKKINDQYGHLVGTRAIERIGEVLRNVSRSIDTPARHGGDEFALVLPESGASQAAQVAARILERLAHDGQEPAISASVGHAVYPEDGATIEQLMNAADTALYKMKGRKLKILQVRRAVAGS
jgi:diguanylate cyclase (GGDEF)-like protein